MLLLGLVIERSTERPAVGAAELTSARAETVEKIAVVNRILVIVKRGLNSEQLDELKIEFGFVQCSCGNDYCSDKTSLYMIDNHVF